jgi:hypothetical protein
MGEMYIGRLEDVPARLQYFFVILGLDLSVWQ